MERPGGPRRRGVPGRPARGPGLLGPREAGGRGPLAALALGELPGHAPVLPGGLGLLGAARGAAFLKNTKNSQNAL